MQWDETGFYGAGDSYYDGGSYDPVDYSSGFEWASPVDVSSLYQQPTIPNASLYSDYGGGMSDPGAMLQGVAQANDLYAPPAGGPGIGDSLLGGLGGLGAPGILGLGGGLASLIGALTAGGVTGRTTPQMSTPMRAAGNQAYSSLQGLQPFISGTSPLQQTQSSLLMALANGQATPGLQQLIQQAYQPVAQSIYQQATEAGRASGFHDAPAQSPAGGAVLGPALAQLQGQEANSLLNAMYQVPGLFQQPINTQANAAGTQASGFNQLMNAYPYGQTNSIPLGAQVGQGFGNALTGLGTSISNNAAQAQTTNWQNQMLAQQQQQNAQFQRLLAGGGSQALSQPFSGAPGSGGGDAYFRSVYGTGRTD